MTDKAKVWAMMAIGAIVGGISGAETAGKLPGKLKNAMELAKTGKLEKDHTKKPAEDNKQE